MQCQINALLLHSFFSVLAVRMKKKKIQLRDLEPKQNQGGHTHGDGHNHSTTTNHYKPYIPAIVSFAMLIIGIAFDYFDVAFFKDWIRIIWYSIAYIPVGFPVIKEGWKSCLLYTSPSPRDLSTSRMPSSA